MKQITGDEEETIGESREGSPCEVPENVRGAVCVSVGGDGKTPVVELLLGLNDFQSLTSITNHAREKQSRHGEFPQPGWRTSHPTTVPRTEGLESVSPHPGFLPSLLYFSLLHTPFSWAKTQYREGPQPKLPEATRDGSRWSVKAVTERCAYYWSLVVL